MSAYENLRPVIIAKNAMDISRKEYNDEEQGGLFHCWGGTSERVYGVIELKDGAIVLILSNYFRFTDQLFNSQLINIRRNK